MELKDRERKVNVESLTKSEAEAISLQLGEKIRQICDKAVEDANKFLNVYGMCAKMQIVIDQKDGEKNSKELKKGKVKSKKASQSLG